jgi:hypothetical protein
MRRRGNSSGVSALHTLNATLTLTMQARPMNRRTTNLGVGEALDLLGLPAAADGETLRRAFNAAVKAAHPDRPGGDHERLRLVIEAYRLLQLRPPAANAAPAPQTRAETSAQAKLRRFTAAWAA